ncbi:MAG: MiaB/RimO family radical SAM methylthiotransferase [Defluviitaleaceae bacterium]|nr:MiaB/RimO family radical SAM methylthiotransferase [Defluviitaleaceae bacterium]
MLKIAVHTLGCKVNQCDADALVASLCARGHNAFCTRDFDQNADIFVINTCTVTHVSDKKSRQMLRRARKFNPNARIAMCGCMAKNSAQIDGVDFVFDAREPHNFFEKARQARSGHRGHMSEAARSLEAGSNFPVHEKARQAPYPAAPPPTATKTRTFIKIQDGCDRFCTYCIVPHVRGELKSRPPHEILAEAEELVASGTLEIVLTGIQLAAYGQNFGTADTSKMRPVPSKPDSLSFLIKETFSTADTSEMRPVPSNPNSLSFLIKEISACGVPRLRLSSIDPWAVTDEFLDAVQKSPALCDHFHLSLQSGCDATLLRMNRRYTPNEYAAVVTALKKIRPNAAVTTDIIVGFPGETDADFEESLRFAREMAFAQIHVFEYSAREGTPAASFSGQIPPKILHERGKIMRALAAELQKNFLNAQIGKIANVLFEKEKSRGVFVGNTENYCAVTVESHENLVRTIRKVKITARSEDCLMGVKV